MDRTQAGLGNHPLSARGILCGSASRVTMKIAKSSRSIKGKWTAASHPPLTDRLDFFYRCSQGRKAENCFPANIDLVILRSFGVYTEFGIAHILVVIRHLVAKIILVIRKLFIHFAF